MSNLERPSKAGLHFDDENYPEDPSVHFALFKNKYASTDRHPSEVGKIELSEELLNVRWPLTEAFCNTLVSH